MLYLEISSLGRIHLIKIRGTKIVCVQGMMIRGWEAAAGNIQGCAYWFCSDQRL